MSAWNCGAGAVAAVAPTQVDFVLGIGLEVLAMPAARNEVRGVGRVFLAGAMEVIAGRAPFAIVDGYEVVVSVVVRHDLGREVDVETPCAAIVRVDADQVADRLEQPGILCGVDAPTVAVVPCLVLEGDGPHTEGKAAEDVLDVTRT